MNASTMEIIGAVLFAIALLHTFSTKFFEHLAHTSPRHAGLWHLLGEVEVVFGFWAMVLVLFFMSIEGTGPALHYLDTRNFTEPMFVFAIMVIAASRPILEWVGHAVRRLAELLPLRTEIALYFLLLFLVPLMGSLITEPGAMTLAALILSEKYFRQKLSPRLQYATLGVLFVNVSIGGTLTHFAAPPVLMVAAKWQWDTPFMLLHFGWRSALAVFINAAVVSWIFRRELLAVKMDDKGSKQASSMPLGVVLIHFLFLVGVVICSHHSAAFMGLFLFFMGFVTAYPAYQGRLILREGLLVAFFLAGLVVLGGLQQWWLEPLLRSMGPDSVYFGATALTAITDNAALTYLGSLVDGLSDEFKYALVAGAVTGGGLTVIANAPNPAGFAILKRHFSDEAIHPLGLFVAASAPTIVAILMFRLF